MLSNVITLLDKTFTLYIKKQEIQHAIENLAARIDEDYKHTTPLFISVLNGSFLFTADLVRNYTGNCEVTFVKMESYAGTNSTGKVNELIGLSKDLLDRDIIILEDIVDTGNTITALINILKQRQPKSIKIATLLYKPEAYHKEIALDYVGIEIPDKFVVGYGLDYDGLGRNLGDIYQVM